MVNNILSVIVFLILLPHSTFAKQNSEDDELRNLTQGIFNQFKEYTKFVDIPLGDLKFNNSKQTHALNGNKDISISISQIAPMVRNESILFKKLFIRFVLAHELGHRLQYANYPKNVIENRKGEGLIFLECNADIFASFISTGVFNLVELPLLVQNSNFDINAYNRIIYTTATKVYRRIFEMDLDNPFSRTHPSHLQRLMAVKSGTLLGNYVNMQFVLPPKGNTELKQHQFQIETFKIIGKAINYNVNDNPYVWAHLEAIRIINENNQLATRLVRYAVNIKRERIPGTSDRSYNYSFRIFNGNNVSVRFAGRVYSEIDFGNDRDNLMKSIPIDSSPFETVISAGSSIEINGKVSYVIQDTLSSKLILPGDKKSLYFVFDATRPTTDTTNIGSSNSDFTEWRVDIEEDIYDHISGRLRVRDHLTNLRRGIGISEATTDEELRSLNTAYQPLFKAGDHEDQVLIYFPRTQNIIYEFLATETPNFSTASQRFDLILNKIKQGIGKEYVFNLLQTDSSGRRIEARDNNDKRVLLIRLITDLSTNNYKVLVDIYGR